MYNASRRPATATQANRHHAEGNVNVCRILFSNPAPINHAGQPVSYMIVHEAQDHAIYWHICIILTMHEYVKIAKYVYLYILFISF